MILQKISKVRWTACVQCLISTGIGVDAVCVSGGMQL